MDARRMSSRPNADDAGRPGMTKAGPGRPSPDDLMEAAL